MPETKKIIAMAPAEPERRAAGRYTGRYIVTARPAAHPEVSMMLRVMGMQAAASASHGAAPAHALLPGTHITLDRVGIILVDPGKQEDALAAMAAQSDAVLALEPERINRAFPNTADYIQGWRDALDALNSRLSGTTQAAAAQPPAAPACTWGLDATHVCASRFSGAGIRLAVLDTGLDLGHPDFAGRHITVQNFVGDNTPFHDGHGHGTHCCGTAAGPRQPPAPPRYGVAGGVDLYVGRVLDDSGRGGDFNILQGIDWAIAQGCQIISMSLGAPWSPGDPPYSPSYETAAQRALAAGCLIVVAAGNDADTPGYVGAVGTPGNSPSVLTVAAVDEKLATAPFSNRATPAAPGVKGPDLAGPGVNVYSTWPMPQRYNVLSGTSMATPHVAGIAALFAESSPALRGQALKAALIAHCEALANAAARQGEIGAGLVQAP